jgi:hypothetical protein
MSGAVDYIVEQFLYLEKYTVIERQDRPCWEFNATMN